MRLDATQHSRRVIGRPLSLLVRVPLAREHFKGVLRASALVTLLLPMSLPDLQDEA